MSAESYVLSSEDSLQLVIGSAGLLIDDAVLTNGNTKITSRALLTSYPDEEERRKIIAILSFATAGGQDAKKCIVELLKRAAQEGKLRL
ncbi:MAG: hypothetical protein J5966_09405 [Lachnospiraceae bacterium]|nr:hypothetical protein [Lachnospiraceae bacterium]